MRGRRFYCNNTRTCTRILSLDSDSKMLKTPDLLRLRGQFKVHFFTYYLMSHTIMFNCHKYCARTMLKITRMCRNWNGFITLSRTIIYLIYYIIFTLAPARRGAVSIMLLWLYKRAAVVFIRLVKIFNTFTTIVVGIQFFFFISLLYTRLHKWYVVSTRLLQKRLNYRILPVYKSYRNFNEWLRILNNWISTKKFRLSFNYHKNVVSYCVCTS